MDIVVQKVNVFLLLIPKKCEDYKATWFISLIT